MELTYEEQLKLDNSREHLKVVLSNIRIANNQLSKVYDDLTKAKLILLKTEQDGFRISKDNSEAMAAIEYIKSVQDRREESLLSRESKQVELDKDSETKRLKAEDELAGVNKEIAQAKIDGNKLIETYSSIVLDLESKITESITKLKNYEEEIKEQSGVKKEIENEITRLSSEAEEAQKGLDRFKLESDKEMKSITALIEEEKNKIKNPLELIRRETEKNKIARNDLQILKIRLAKQFKEKNPKGNLPLELQKK